MEKCMTQEEYNLACAALDKDLATLLKKHMETFPILGVVILCYLGSLESGFEMEFGKVVTQYCTERSKYIMDNQQSGALH